MRIGWIALALVGCASPVLAQDAVPMVKTADYEFGYAYPAAAGRVPGLKAWLEADRARLRTKTMRDGAAARREAAKSGFPYRRYSYVQSWKLVTQTPRFVSLSGDSYDYTGGAHGQPASYGLVWDKTTGRPLEPKALFTSVAALQSATRTGYCARLKAEQARRNEGAVSSMSNCPSIMELTLLLGSSSGRAIDRIGLIADPYVAGSYAEGSYEVTLPVTPVILKTVKPAYRGAFAVRP